MVMIIRHAEKPARGGVGVDVTGRLDGHSLTRRGWSRASGLVDLFGSRGAPARAGLTRPTVIYAAHANGDGAGKRTRQTVQALAKDLNVPVNTDFGKGDEAALARKLATETGPVLVCWQHGEIPALAAAFRPVTPAPPRSWPESRFDMVWTLTPTGPGWAFAEIPELVMPGDSPRTFD
jgi:hypothetical protein